jgi:predicted ATPase/DNA-binding CsgD family transcriptional regulator
MAARSSGVESLPEALTQRERNILAHLANNLSSVEIAGLETLAPSSVKWYMHQLYTKLGVNNRAAALRRARELALLRGTPAAQPRTNLPRQFSSFIGREREIAQLLELVQACPLVTLTGSGGTGKTRLALQAAERALPDFPGGAWFVDLAPLSDPALVAMVAATALGIHAIARETAQPTLIETIALQRLLLVLDNCEHLIAASAGLVLALLQACPRLHILATSREIMGITGERALRCPPLSLPDPVAPLALAELARFEAPRLFAARAAEAMTGFQITAANAAIVEQICRRLDGIPLAIELAAARLRLLSLKQIATRLEDIFYLLTGGGRSFLPRQKTLKAMIDWSYDLLSEPERRLLARLSVFSGGWTLEAAEDVCPADDLSREAVLDLLAQLADKSLVDVQAGRDGQPRYRLLEMIRQYAWHRLRETGEVEAARERHLDYFTALALRAEAELRGPASRVWKERLEDELPNIRAGLEWALAGSAVKGLSLAAGLYWYWFGSTHRLEGVDWLDRLLAAEETGRAERSEIGHTLQERQLARGKALYADHFMGLLSGRENMAMVQEASAIFEPLHELYPREAAYALLLKGGNSLDELLELARMISYPFLQCEILMRMSDLACWAGRLADSWSLSQELLALSRATGDLNNAAVALWKEGTLHFMQGRFAAALESYLSSRDSFVRAGNEEFLPFLHRFPAWLALARGDTGAATALSRLQLEESQAINVSWVAADALGFLAWEALSAGNQDAAQHFCDQAFALREMVGDDLLSVAFYSAARLALGLGNLEQARLQMTEFVRHNYHNFPPVQLGLQLFAMLALVQAAADTAQAHRAALLFGAQDALAPCLLNVIPPPEREAYHAALAAVRTLLPPAEFAAAFAQGQTLDAAQAIEYALKYATFR